MNWGLNQFEENWYLRFLILCLTVVLNSLVVKDGEEWIFTVRKLETLPDYTAIVNYDGFAEGISSWQQASLFTAFSF